MLFDSQFNDELFIKNSNDIMVDSSVNGLVKGNMFTNEYDPYKNYNPSKLEAIDEKGKLLLKIMEIDFAIKDLNLYLDLYPNDNNIYSLFKEYVNKSLELKNNYENMYGPLDIYFVKKDSYDYLNSSWPWDDFGGIKYV